MKVKDKGNRFEREAVKLLSVRFPGRGFSRVVGSGNRWAQVGQLTESGKNVLVGDLVAPEGFRWVVEVKAGYEDRIDFHSIFDGNRTLDGFLDQSLGEAERSGRKPLILYKRSRKPWVGMIPVSELTEVPSVALRYRGWWIVSLDWLLSLPDNFYFTE